MFFSLLGWNYMLSWCLLLAVSQLTQTHKIYKNTQRKRKVPAFKSLSTKQYKLNKVK